MIQIRTLPELEAARSSHQIAHITEKAAKKMREQRPVRERVRKSAPVAPAEAPASDITDDDIADDLCAVVKEEIRCLIREIRMRPSRSPAIAAARARDAKTRGELVRMLEKLHALEQGHSGDKRKTKVRDESERKAVLIRKINQVLDAGREKQSSGDAKPG